MFGWDVEVDAWSRFWRWNWSRFVFELEIWTQPSGPLCLWQCFWNDSGNQVKKVPVPANQVARGAEVVPKRTRRVRRMPPPTRKTRNKATRTGGGPTTRGSASGYGTSTRPSKSLAGSAPATRSLTSQWPSWGSSTTPSTWSWPSSSRWGSATWTRRWRAFSGRRRAPVQCCKTQTRLRTGSPHPPPSTRRAVFHPSPSGLFPNYCWDILVHQSVVLEKLQALFARLGLTMLAN